MKAVPVLSDDRVRDSHIQTHAQASKKQQVPTGFSQHTSMDSGRELLCFSPWFTAYLLCLSLLICKMGMRKANRFAGRITV